MTTKVPVSERALFRRINRALKQSGRQLHKARTAKAIVALGGYYVSEKRAIVQQRVKLEPFGRKLGVLQDFEKVQ